MPFRRKVLNILSHHACLPCPSTNQHRRISRGNAHPVHITLAPLPTTPRDPATYHGCRNFLRPPGRRQSTHPPSQPATPPDADFVEFWTGMIEHSIHEGDQYYLSTIASSLTTLSPSQRCAILTTIQHLASEIREMAFFIRHEHRNLHSGCFTNCLDPDNLIPDSESAQYRSFVRHLLHPSDRGASSTNSEKKSRPSCTDMLKSLLRAAAACARNSGETMKIAKILLQIEEDEEEEEELGLNRPEESQAEILARWSLGKMK